MLYDFVTRDLNIIKFRNWSMDKFCESNAKILKTGVSKLFRGKFILLIGNSNSRCLTKCAAVLIKLT